MFQPAVFFEMGKTRSGIIVLPVANTTNVNFPVSTRYGDLIVKRGDGSADTPYVPYKFRDFTVSVEDIGFGYASSYTGDFKMVTLNGNKDVYSIAFRWNKSYNIQNIGNFLAQFPNLFSIDMSIYMYGVEADKPTIKGDISQLPNTVERVRGHYSFQVKNSATDFYLNINNFSSSSSLNSFNWEVDLKVNGNLANIPIGCNFFKIGNVYPNSSITYTAGKVWASSFDTLSIPLILTTTELDNLLIDMNNSITTKIGAGVISLGGYRSTTSDAAVASLQAKGFTVNINRVLNNVSNVDSALLRLDFQNNFDVYSNSGINIISGGNLNPPTFALSGRKPGEYCAVFNGSQSIKTTTNLPINSDKVTIAFWMKTTQTAHSKIVDLNVWSGGNRFTIGINDGAKIRAISGPAPNVCDNQSAINNGEWKHIVFTFDRAQVANQEIKMYINGVLATTTNGISNNGTGNFENQILTIGASGSSLYFNGSLTRLKAYNYPLTPTEVTNLYNSEL